MTILLPLLLAASDLAKPKNEAPEPEHLLRDWTKDWHDQGLDLAIGFQAEPAAVVKGKRHGVDYAQQVELRLDADWGRIAGAKGLKTHVIFVNRAGRNAARDYAGDKLFQIQDIYGGTDHAPIHLVEAYADYTKGGVSIAAGRLPVGEDYATSPLYCAFMNTALCGYPHSLPAKVGFSVFPNSSWCGRVRVAGKRVYGQGGIYQVRPKFGGKWGFDWGFSGTTGAYIPLEIGWEPEIGSQALPGHYKLGWAHDTSDYDDNLRDATGALFPVTGAPPRRHDGRNSFYALADQMILRKGDGGLNGLVALAGYVHSSAATSQISGFAFAGLVDQGLLPGRPDDSPASWLPTQGSAPVWPGSRRLMASRYKAGNGSSRLVTTSPLPRACTSCPTFNI